MFSLTKEVLKLLNNKQKKELVLLFFVMIIGSIFESVSVSLVLPLVSAIESTNSWNSNLFSKTVCSTLHITTQKDYVIMLVLSLIVIFFVKNIFLFFEKNYQNRYVSKVKIDIRKKLMNILMKKDYEYFVNTNPSEIIRTINSDSSESFRLLENILIFFTEFIVCFVLAISLIIMSPLMSLIMIIALGLEALILTKVIRPYMNRLGETIIEEYVTTEKWLYSCINGIKSIKVTDKSEFFISNYINEIIKCFDIERKQANVSALPRMFIETFTIVFVLIYVLIYIINGGKLSELIPVLSAFAVAAVRLLPCVSSITTTVNDSTYRIPALNRTLEYLKDLDIVDNHIVNGEKVNFESTIELKNISFKYSKSNKYIIKNASMSIYEGESVGIVGKSGAGKTTSIDILLGLLKPESGGVYIDGVNIEDNMHSWLEQLAYIPQQIYLMDTSIRENVAFGVNKNDVSDEKVWNALKEAQLEEYVQSLPDGLDTNVGERGVRLSGGQIQRMGIARALYNNPKVLVFDEATSSLDNDTEKAIMESIDSLKGKKTMIIIAHRLSTIENCDVIYKVENRKIYLERSNRK